MIERKRGHIVATSSLVGLNGAALSLTYSTSKFAVRGFMESLTMDLTLKKHDSYIKTSTVFPYFISTNKTIVDVYEKGMKGPNMMLKPDQTAQEYVTRVLQNEEIIVLPRYITPLFYDM